MDDEATHGWSAPPPWVPLRGSVTLRHLGGENEISTSGEVELAAAGEAG